MVDDNESHEPGAVLPGTPYLVGRRLGRGGMGTVYDTTHLKTGERYAVKVLSTRLAGRLDLEVRMLREAAVLGSLDAPNIVRIVDVGYLATDVPYYAMERLEGQTLRNVLRRRGGPLAPGFACGLARQVLEALTVVHGAGIVHRDVKPENLFLRTNGTCVLLDFGLVKVMLDDGRFGPHGLVTAQGHLVGTNRYMPPEIFDGLRAPFTHRADLYAVGVVLVELLTGRLPLDDAPDEVYMAYLAQRGFPHRYDPPWVPRVPDALRPVVERATAKNPADRFPSAQAFADELVRACERGGIELSDCPLPPAPPPAPRRFWSRTFASGVVSGAALALTAVAIVAWRPGAPVDVRAVAEPRLTPPAPASPAAAPPDPPSAPPAPASPAVPSVSAAASARAPKAPASAGRLGRRAQLLAKLRSGRGTLADAEQLDSVCRDLGDTSCRLVAFSFLARFEYPR